MKFSINEFKTNLSKRGVIQNNKYEISFNFESMLSETSETSDSLLKRISSIASMGEINNELSLRCTDVSLPGLNLLVSDKENRFGLGLREPMPFSASYAAGNFSMSFIADKDNLVHKFWRTYLNYIFQADGRITQTTPSSRTFYTVEYKDNYSSNIDIVVYDNDSSTTIHHKIHKVFPVAINDINLSWGDNNKLLKITVKLGFTEIESVERESDKR
jgi:hypothetical protein